MRFAALGDSATVGMGDPLPDGGWRGWADLLADALRDAELHNFARNGARAADVATVQLPRALRARPALASVIVGANDTLRGNFHLAGFARDFAAAIAALTRAGAVVLTATLPDPGRMLGVPEMVCRPLARRARAINAVVSDLAERYGTVHVDVAGHPRTYTRSMWGIDRLHPSEAGHRAMARIFAGELAAHGLAVDALPSPEPEFPPPSPATQMRWLATKGTAWLARRSRDLLPTMTRLTVQEWRHARQNRTIELDHLTEAEVQRVLAGLIARSSTRGHRTHPGFTYPN